MHMSTRRKVNKYSMSRLETQIEYPYDRVNAEKQKKSILLSHDELLGKKKKIENKI